MVPEGNPARQDRFFSYKHFDSPTQDETAQIVSGAHVFLVSGDQKCKQDDVQMEMVMVQSHGEIADSLCKRVQKYLQVSASTPEPFLVGFFFIWLGRQIHSISWFKLHVSAFLVGS